MKPKVNGVYLVAGTRSSDQYSYKELIRQAVTSGVSVVQFRDKEASPREALEAIRNIKPICRDNSALLIVNDRPDMVMASGADGVHLGQNDLPIHEARKLLGAEKIIGGTASTLEEAREVEKAGADYLGFGHIYRTHTKYKGYAPRGVKRLQEVTEALSIPVIAIGGIEAEGAEAVMRHGAAGFAVSSAVCHAEDPARAARRLREIYQSTGVG